MADNTPFFSGFYKIYLDFLVTFRYFSIQGITDKRSFPRRTVSGRMSLKFLTPPTLWNTMRQHLILPLYLHRFASSSTTCSLTVCYLGGFSCKQSAHSIHIPCLVGYLQLWVDFLTQWSMIKYFSTHFAPE